VRHTYQPGRPLLPWIHVIAGRVRVDHHRKAVRTTVREQPLEDFSDTPVAEHPQAEDLEELLAPLSDGQREVLEMLKVAGMLLEKAAQAVRSRTQPARRLAFRKPKAADRRIPWHHSTLDELIFQGHGDVHCEDPAPIGDEHNWVPGAAITPDPRPLGKLR
jgi:DNA-directed RNA polymerase specialized sigma24 family protein